MSNEGEQLVKIEVNGSTHVRTAQQWIDLARADLRKTTAASQDPCPNCGRPKPEELVRLDLMKALNAVETLSVLLHALEARGVELSNVEDRIWEGATIDLVDLREKYK